MTKLRQVLVLSGISLCALGCRPEASVWAIEPCRTALVIAGAPTAPLAVGAFDTLTGRVTYCDVVNEPPRTIVIWSSLGSTDVLGFALLSDSTLLIEARKSGVTTVLAKNAREPAVQAAVSVSVK